MYKNSPWTRVAQMKHVTFFSDDLAAGRRRGSAAPEGYEALPIADGNIDLKQLFLPDPKASQLLGKLLAKIDWQQDKIRLFGKTHLLPRLHQWYGDEGTAYRWSGIQMHPRPWIRDLMALRYAVEQDTGARFNCVLINLYRDGRDSMGWHADDEAVLGPCPAIASISLGAERDLLLRRRGALRASHAISLRHGSLLLMRGETQRNWQHALPRRKKVLTPRINLTFRYIEPADNAPQ